MGVLNNFADCQQNEVEKGNTDTARQVEGEVEERAENVPSTFLFLREDNQIGQWTFEDERQKRDELLFLVQSENYQNDYKIRRPSSPNSTESINAQELTQRIIIDGMVLPTMVVKTSKLLREASACQSQNKVWEKGISLSYSEANDVLTSLQQIGNLTTFAFVLPYCLMCLTEKQIMSIIKTSSIQQLDDMSRSMLTFRPLTKSNELQNFCVTLFKSLNEVSNKSQFTESEIIHNSLYLLQSLVREVFNDENCSSERVCNIGQYHSQLIKVAKQCNKDNITLICCSLIIVFMHIVETCGKDSKQIIQSSILIDRYFDQIQHDIRMDRKTKMITTVYWSLIKLELSYNHNELSGILMCSLLLDTESQNKKDNDDPFQPTERLPKTLVNKFVQLSAKSDFIIPSWQFFWKLIHLSNIETILQVNAVSFIKSTSLYCAEAKDNDIEGRIIAAFSSRDSHLIKYISAQSVIDLFDNEYYRLGLFLCNSHQRFFDQLAEKGLENKALLEKVLVAVCRFTHTPFAVCPSLLKRVAELIVQVSHTEPEDPFDDEMKDLIDFDDIEIEMMGMHEESKFSTLDEHGDVIIDIHDVESILSIPSSTFDSDFNIQMERVLKSPSPQISPERSPLQTNQPIRCFPVKTEPNLSKPSKLPKSTQNCIDQWQIPLKSVHDRAVSGRGKYDNDSFTLRHTKGRGPIPPSLAENNSTSSKKVSSVTVISRPSPPAAEQNNIKANHTNHANHVPEFYSFPPGTIHRMAFSYIPGAAFEDSV